MNFCHSCSEKPGFIPTAGQLHRVQRRPGQRLAAATGGRGPRPGHPVPGWWRWSGAASRPARHVRPRVARQRQSPEEKFSRLPVCPGERLRGAYCAPDYASAPRRQPATRGSRYHTHASLSTHHTPPHNLCTCTLPLLKNNARYNFSGHQTCSWNAGELCSAKPPALL